MAGSNRLSAVKSGTAANPADQVQSVAGYNPATKTAYVFVLNHNPSTAATTSESAVVNLSRIMPATGTTVNVKKWTVDDTHGNFWPTWWYSPTWPASFPTAPTCSRSTPPRCRST